MEELQHILVAVTREVDCGLVLEKVRILASAANSTVQVIRVIHDEVVDSGIPAAGVPASGVPASGVPTEADRHRLKSYIMESEEAYLEELVAGFAGDFEDIGTATIWNKREWEGITDAARDLAADLVVKVANIEPRIREVVHTPDDWNLLRHARCPVMLVKPERWEAVPVIVAAVDILDDAHGEMNLEILRRAHVLTSILGGDLHLVNAYPLFEPWVGELGAGYNYEEIKEGVESELREKIRSVMECTQIECKGIHVREGKPSMVIRDVVEESRADIVVMGTVGRGGVAGLVLGNTSEAVLHVVNTDVVTIRIA